MHKSIELHWKEFHLFKKMVMKRLFVARILK